MTTWSFRQRHLYATGSSLPCPPAENKGLRVYDITLSPFSGQSAPNYTHSGHIPLVRGRSGHRKGFTMTILPKKKPQQQSGAAEVEAGEASSSASHQHQLPIGSLPNHIQVRTLITCSSLPSYVVVFIPCNPLA